MPTEGQRELKQLGEAIRMKRKALATSQEDFAELAGIHRTYAGHVERGESNLSFHNLLRIANALKIRPSTLLRDAGL